MACLKYSSNKSEFEKSNLTLNTESGTPPPPPTNLKSNIQSYRLGLQMHVCLKDIHS